MQMDVNTKLKCIGLLWSWWKVRNRVNAGEGSCNTPQLVAQVYRLAAEYEEFFVKSKCPRVKIGEKWKAPEGDVLKINTDGSFH
jgi:hypothetical protein